MLHWTNIRMVWLVVSQTWSWIQIITWSLFRCQQQAKTSSTVARNECGDEIWWRHMHSLCLNCISEDLQLILLKVFKKQFRTKSLQTFIAICIGFCFHSWVIHHVVVNWCPDLLNNLIDSTVKVKVKVVDYCLVTSQQRWRLLCSLKCDQTSPPQYSFHIHECK